VRVADLERLFPTAVSVAQHRAFQEVKGTPPTLLSTQRGGGQPSGSPGRRAVFRNYPKMSAHLTVFGGGPPAHPHEGVHRGDIPVAVTLHVPLAEGVPPHGEGGFVTGPTFMSPDLMSGCIAVLFEYWQKKLERTNSALIISSSSVTFMTSLSPGRDGVELIGFGRILDPRPPRQEMPCCQCRAARWW